MEIKKAMSPARPTDAQADENSQPKNPALAKPQLGIGNVPDSFEMSRPISIPGFSPDDPKGSIRLNEKVQGDVTEQGDSELGQDLEIPRHAPQRLIDSRLPEVKEKLVDYLRTEENYEKFENQDNSEVGFHNHSRSTHFSYDDTGEPVEKRDWTVDSPAPELPRRRKRPGS